MNSFDARTVPVRLQIEGLEELQDAINDVQSDAHALKQSLEQLERKQYELTVWAEPVDDEE